MKRITLLLILLSAGISASAKKWTITNVGFTFSPTPITIEAGDTVVFSIASIHEVVEVSEATWNANGNDPLEGGFSTNPGGGTVLPSFLQAGTHFYVCVPHASSGMKGKIIVQGSTATEDIHFPAEVSVYPNPSDGRFQVIMDNIKSSKKYDLDIYNTEGKRVYLKSRSEIELVNIVDLSGAEKGIYILNLSDGRKTYSKKIIIQ